MYLNTDGAHEGSIVGGPSFSALFREQPGLEHALLAVLILLHTRERRGEDQALSAECRSNNRHFRLPYTW